MTGAFGRRLRELRIQREILQSTLAEQCKISSAYLSDIERGRRNPPADQVILAWARLLDPGNAEEIGRELIDLAARDQGRAEDVTETETEPAGVTWEVAGSRSGEGIRAERTEKRSKTPFLDHFCVDLVERAREGCLDPVQGRAWELGEIACVVARRRGNSVVLTCETGAEVYRTIQGLACEIAQGRGPDPLVNKRLLMLGGGLQAGVKYRGQFEERLNALISEAVGIGDVLLYCHSLGDLIELEGNAKGSYFRPALQAGALQMVTGATPGEMDYCRKVNADLTGCFSPVRIRPLDRKGVLRGLYALRERYGEHHGISYSEGALVAIVDAAEAGDDVGFWQRALDLLDEVGARARLAGRTTEITVDGVDRATEELAARGDGLYGEQEAAVPGTESERGKR